jgi:hypothetical protein
MIPGQFPKPYPSQFDLRGDTFTCYGSDFRGCVSYTFNSQGYRSEFDYDITDTAPLLVCLGSSIATGHGLDLAQSFGHIVGESLCVKSWNLGQGCFRSSNQTILEQVEYLANSSLNIRHYVIQFTHINRTGNKFNSYLELDSKKAVENFCGILKKISNLLHNKSWCWLLTDYSDAELPNWVTGHPNKIVIDPDSMDFVDTESYKHLTPSTHALQMLSLHPGPQWNQHIASLILNYLHGR